MTTWQLGEVDRARELIEQANRRASDLGHAPSMVPPLLWKVHLEILRGDPAAALSGAEALDSLGREHGMPFYRADAGLNAAWAHGRLHDAAAGAEDLRRGLADRVHQGARYNPWFYNGLLAELEAETLGLESALARLDEALALAQQVEYRCNLAFPHLLRGGGGSRARVQPRNFFPRTPPSTTLSTFNAISLGPNAPRASRCGDDHVADRSRSSLTIPDHHDRLLGEGSFASPSSWGAVADESFLRRY